MKDFCILGSGIAGSTIADLVQKKYSIEVFDKARGAGGRSATRKYLNQLNFDHGLQYFSPKNKMFKNFIKKLEKKKVIKEWLGTHIDFTFKESKKKYIGKKGNNDICKFLLKNIKVNYNCAITKIVFKKKYWTVTLKNKKKIDFKNLILTCPYPQVKLLAGKYLTNKIKKFNVKMEPNITVMAVTKQEFMPLSSFKINNKLISWIANENSKKRFKSKFNLWTIQASLKFSKKIINSYKKKRMFFSSIIVKEFSKILGINQKKIIFKDIHGWKYAYSLGDKKIDSFWSRKYNLGICGDWINGSKAEDAWLSAYNLFRKIKKSSHKGSFNFIN